MGLTFGFLLLLPACSGFAQAVCEREQAISEAVHEAGDFLGPVGHVLDTVVGLGLGILCGSVEVVCTGVDAGADAIGLIDTTPVEEDPGS